MTLKELAALLGLSPTTVSRALNGYPEVNEETRRRVQDAARLHDYHPNTRAQSLALGRAMAIGHVIPVSTNNEIVNPIFGDFIAGAGEVYSQAGYDMVLSVVSDEAELAAYRKLRARQSVDGVILHAPRRDDPRLSVLAELRLPFVVHGRATGSEIPYSWVDVNNKRAIFRAVQFLMELGHSRIGLINGRENMDFALRRRAGFVEALQGAGLAPDPALMHSAEMSETEAHRATRRMMALPQRPTALIVSSIVSAIGVRRATDELGLTLGRDLSVVAYDDDISYLRNGDEVPLFTAMQSSVRDAGRRAARMLIDLIEHPGSSPRSEMLEATLQLGLSTGPAPRD